MKTILTKEQKKNFLSDNWKLKTLITKFSTSYARDSYGYTICTLKDSRNNKISSTCGGGYDMRGTVLGHLINKYFYNEIRKLNSDDFYGLTHYGKNYRHLKNASKFGTSHVDGGCGWESMVRILNKIGFDVKYLTETKKSTTYQLTIR